MGGTRKFSTSIFIVVTAATISMMALVFYKMLYARNIEIIIISIVSFSVLMMVVKNNWERFHVAR